MNATILERRQDKKMHPHKFTMWVAMASIVMMFAGLTSALIVKSNLAGWRNLEIPKIFWVSTAVIIASSIIVQLALKAFRERNMQQYRTLMILTTISGVVFVICQVIGFNQLWAQQVHFKGASGGGQFFYAIAGLHALHVLGGITALVVMVIKSYFGKTKNYSAVPVEVMSMYWHFVDILWVYLIVFFLIVR